MILLSNRRSTTAIIVHASDTYAHMDTTARDIDLWHRKRGFFKGGYHFVIRRSGLIESGDRDPAHLRETHEVGAHVSGHNSYSIGICLVGGRGADDKPEDNFTPEQRDSLVWLIKWLRVQWPNARILGHRDLDPNKACPCFDYAALMREHSIELNP